MENKTVTAITDINSLPAVNKTNITDEQLKCDYNYYVAQTILKKMLDNGLISADEFNKISRKNLEKFSPYLVEIIS